MNNRSGTFEKWVGYHFKIFKVSSVSCLMAFLREVVPIIIILLRAGLLMRVTFLMIIRTVDPILILDMAELLNGIVLIVFYQPVHTKFRLI